MTARSIAIDFWRITAAALCLPVLLLLFTSFVDASEWVKREGVQLRLVPSMTALNSSTDTVVGLEIQLEPGWQFYSQVPGEAAVAPIFDWSASGNLKSASIYWPKPTRYVYSTKPPVSALGYKNAVLLPIVLKAETAEQDCDVRLKLEYGLCNEFCILDKIELRLTLPNGPGDATPDNERIMNALMRARLIAH